MTVVSIDNKECIELYFVYSVANAGGYNARGGAVIEVEDNSDEFVTRAIAHEIGHECGLDDIYILPTVINCAFPKSDFPTSLLVRTGNQA